MNLTGFDKLSALLKINEPNIVTFYRLLMNFTCLNVPRSDKIVWRRIEMAEKARILLLLCTKKFRTVLTNELGVNIVKQQIRKGISNRRNCLMKNNLHKLN